MKSTDEQKESSDIYNRICAYENLRCAYEKARKHKTRKPYVKAFQEHLEENLQALHKELSTQTYKPAPLKTFILRDPKTRKISKSAFRDRVIHHALCNIIEPLLSKQFIHDSYANQKGKGTLKAIQRFHTFKRKASTNFTHSCFVLKADIKHYFDTVSHERLLQILTRAITCAHTLTLIRIILANHHTNQQGRGMPLGNLTSQFFANVFLNELDHFVKHTLRAKHYIRYVDDFVILDPSPQKLERHKEQINTFLQHHLNLELHPDKSRIQHLQRGISFLGFRIFPHHTLVRKKNLKKFHQNYLTMKHDYKTGTITREHVIVRIEGWLAYTKHANTYKYQRHLLRELNIHFPLTEQPTNAQQHNKITKKIAAHTLQYSTQKTAHMFKKKHSIKKIATQRGIKESTVWNHLANLIEHHQLSLWTVLSHEEIQTIRAKTHTSTDTLKDIKARINNPAITYNKIACVLAYLTAKKKKRLIIDHIKWYKHTNCKRKCHNNLVQRKSCQIRMKRFTQHNPTLELTRKEFLHLFNNHIHICVLPEQEKRKYVTLTEFKQNRNKKLLHQNPG